MKIRFIPIEKLQQWIALVRLRLREQVRLNEVLIQREQRELEKNRAYASVQRAAALAAAACWKDLATHHLKGAFHQAIRGIPGSFPSWWPGVLEQSAIDQLAREAVRCYLERTYHGAVQEYVPREEVVVLFQEAYRKQIGGGRS